jgi:hypothetical protein
MAVLCGANSADGSAFADAARLPPAACYCIRRWRLGRAHGAQQLRQVNPGGADRKVAAYDAPFREMIVRLSGRAEVC